MVIVALLAFILSVSAAWAGGQNEAAKKMEISIVLHPRFGPTDKPLASTGKPSAMVRKMWPMVMKKYPNLTFKIDEILGDTDSREKYLMMCRDGKGPDILGIDCYWAGSFAQINALVALDDLIPKNLQKEILDPFKLKFKGKTICIVPNTDVNGMLWYRTDLFKNAGLSKAPADWNELKDYAAKLTTSDVFGIAAPAGRNEHTSVVHIGLYWQDNFPFVKDEMPTYNNQSSMDIFKLWADLYQKKYMPPDVINGDYDTIQATFYREKAAMMLQGSWQVTMIGTNMPTLAKNVDAAMLPVNPRTKKRGQNSGGWAVALTTRDPGKYEACAYILSLMYGLDKDIYNEWNSELGLLPTNGAVLDNPELKKAGAKLGYPVKWDELIFDSLKYSKVRPSEFAIYPDASLEWAQALQETMLGADPAKTLAEAVERTVQIGKDKGIIQ